ncbi:protein transport protein SFT2-like [Salvia splendens]|uniref:protein transport protein SFT2-like n=1 Tax=Salvia splendens TaxID=180675 RepID=UPI001C27AAE9|nr:protein transport protein SFT2-like [Salvia splendens]
MQKTAQSWFAGGPNSDLDKTSSSLLADWNAYASASEPAAADSQFDLEAAVRSPNLENLFPNLNRVTKGVRDLPGSFNSATSSVPSGQSLVYFGFFLGAGFFFIFIAFTIFLPVMVLKPQKFAICFTIGCAFIVGSFFALRGPKNQLSHMLSKERLPFTIGFLGSMVGTICVSMVLHSYILSVFFSVLQVLALLYYVVSYFPGGSAGMRFLSSALTSSVLRCFGR